MGLLFLLSALPVSARSRDVHYLGQQVSQLHQQSFVRLVGFQKYMARED